MIYAYSLRFCLEDGIVAYADDALFEEFSGPAMKTGHIWKIYLGSRLELDPEDHDGCEFIEGLLEDAMMVEPRFREWKTEEVRNGLWETRPSEELFKTLAQFEVSLDEKEVSDDDEEGVRGDGGEWEWNEDNLEVDKSWAPEEWLLDAASGEAVIVNKYYDTDEDHDEEVDGPEDEVEPGADVEAMDEDEAEPAEVDVGMALQDEDNGNEDGWSLSTHGDGDIAGTDWSEEELSGDDAEMLKDEMRGLKHTRPW